MDNTITDALILMLVGMTSVFTVLTIVVTGGTLLIKAVNKFSPDLPKNGVSSSSKSENQLFLRTETLAVISTSVLHVTKGRGKIDKITRL
jgi:oxaloacetate decarboxylase gamma subunit